jgi:hypothetical protein
LFLFLLLLLEVADLFEDLLDLRCCCCCCFEDFDPPDAPAATPPTTALSVDVCCGLSPSR